MKGNASYYQHKALVEQKELRKLQKARRKYQKILDEIEKEISDTKLNLKRDMHCLSLQCADVEASYISE